MLLLFSTQCRIAPWRLCGELVYWPDGGELDFFNTAGVKHKLWEFTQTRYIFYRNPATLYLLFFPRRKVCVPSSRYCLFALLCVAVKAEQHPASVC